MMGIKEIFMKFLNPKKMAFWMLLLGILLIAGSVFVYKKSKDKVMNDPKTNIPNASTETKEMVFHFFYADWCPHCQNAKKPWQTFCSNKDGKVVNGYKIICKPHDCTDSTSDKQKRDMERFKVEGFPTVVVQKDGKDIEFDAKITEYSLAQFVERMT
jgi:thiol:disulfide interchange protein